MKKFKLIVVCFSTILLMSNIIKYDNGFSSLLVTTLDGSLELPEEPFDYSLVINQALFSDTTGIGYGSGGIDTTILPIISDRVATLGRVLFYDKKLSALEDISCGSCHLQSASFADPKQFSVGVSTPTKRNSMHLNDLGWSNKTSFFWDMGQRDIHEAIKLPLKDDNEIGANIQDVRLKLELTEHYPRLFKEAYGDSEITEERIVDALADFILSINSFNSKFDKQINREEEMSPKEKEGSHLFAEKCNVCHTQGENFFSQFLEAEDFETLSWFQNNGYKGSTDDRGAAEGMPEDFPALFKMPTMRNVEMTAPYMHDGGIPDLDSLINFYSHGVDSEMQSPFMPSEGFLFTEGQKDALKAFLLSLTDDSMLTNPKWSNPFKGANNTDDLGFELKITPNPTSDVAIVNIDAYDGIRKDISVRNMSGQIIFVDYFLGEEYIISRDHLAVGLYIVTVQVDRKLGSYKLIVN